MPNFPLKKAPNRLPANVLAADQLTSQGIKEYSVDHIQGKVVKSQSGDELGTIRDVVVDSRGRVSIAIIAQGSPSWEVNPPGTEWLWGLGIGEKSIAVPFPALSLDESKEVVLNATRDQLDSAPAYRLGDLSNEKQAESVYRFFGQEPYWTEGPCRS